MNRSHAPVPGSGRPFRVPAGTLLLVALVAMPVMTVAAAPHQDVSSIAADLPVDTLYGPDGEPLAFATHGEVRDFLRQGEIVDKEELEIGSTRPERLTLRDGAITARAIFRHVEEQRDRIRLAEGPTYMRFYDSALFEVAAYELGLLLGIDNIPPAVIREVDGRQGTVQIWIEEAFTDSDRIEEELRPANYRRWIRQRADMKVFDALLFNADRNTGNALYGPDWNLWMIDHTRTFQRPTAPVDLSGVNRISRGLWEHLQRVEPEEIRRVLATYLEDPQIDALLERRQAILEHFRRLIRQRGAGAVVLG